MVYVVSIVHLVLQRQGGLEREHLAGIRSGKGNEFESLKWSKCIGNVQRKYVCVCL